MKTVLRGKQVGVKCEWARRKPGSSPTTVKYSSQLCFYYSWWSLLQSVWIVLLNSPLYPLCTRTDNGGLTPGWCLLHIKRWSRPSAWGLPLQKQERKKMILHTVMTIRKCIIKICNTWRQNMVVSVFWYVFITHDSTKLHTPAVKSIPQYCNIYILWIEILMKSRFFPLRPLSFIKPFTAPPSACHYISFRFHFIFSKTLR